MPDHTHVPLDDWPAIRGHRVVEWGRWDHHNLYCRCACGWVGLRHTAPAVEQLWADHIHDQAVLAARLAAPGTSPHPPLPGAATPPEGGQPA